VEKPDSSINAADDMWEFGTTALRATSSAPMRRTITTASADQPQAAVVGP
jgi:hypothetical protein